MSLKQYVGKFVKILDNQNYVWTGYVNDYLTQKDENGQEYDVIELWPNKSICFGPGLQENEIISIEEILEEQVRPWYE